MPEIASDLEPILNDSSQCNEENATERPTGQQRGTAWMLKCFRNTCGVEIPVFIYFVALGILLPAEQHFIYQRICLYKFNSSVICEQIDSDPSLKTQEDSLQREFSFYSSLQMVFLYAPSTLATIFMGTWCDRFSFRIPLLIPHFGTALGTFLLVLYYFLPHTATPPYTLSFPAIIYGTTGASPTEIMTAFAYVSRVTTNRNRTVRVAIVEAALGFGTTTGYLISALVLGRSNTLLAFIVQICCSSYACVFIYFLVPELHTATFQETANKEANGSVFRLFFLPGKKVLDGFRIVFRRFDSSLKNGVHRFILLFLILLTICFVVTSGISAITYAYVTKRPISLSRSSYAVFQALVSGLASFNLLVTLRALRSQWSRCLPLSDIALASIGVCSRLVAYMFMGFADLYPYWAPWVYAVISMASGFFVASLRALLSKLVSITERGSLFALVGVLESLSGMIASTLFNSIYAATIYTPIPFLRGLVFFLSAAVIASPFFIFLWMLCSGEAKKLPFYAQPHNEDPLPNLANHMPSTSAIPADTRTIENQAAKISDRKDSITSSSASFNPNTESDNHINISLQRV